MSGGSRYWDEETQRWVDTGNRGAAPATPPPPPKPYHPPAGPGTAGAGAPEHRPPAADPAGADTGPPVTGPAEAPPVSAPAGWPDAPTQSAWPLPDAEGASTDDAGRPFDEWQNVPWPPVGGPVTSAATGGRRGGLVWSVLIGAVALAVAVTLVLTFVVGGADDKDGRTNGSGGSAPPAPSEPPMPSTPTEPSESTDVSESPTGSTASPSASVSGPPPGYEVYEDEQGFRIVIPEGWERDSVKSRHGMRVVNYRSADRTHRVQVFEVAEPSPKASFDLFLSDETDKPAGFRNPRLDPLDNAAVTGFRLEYLADSIRDEPDLGTWHVYDTRFVASDGKIYAIAVYGPDLDGGGDELKLSTTALEWFCPPLGACGEGPQD